MFGDGRVPHPGIGKVFHHLDQCGIIQFGECHLWVYLFELLFQCLELGRGRRCPVVLNADIRDELVEHLVKVGRRILDDWRFRLATDGGVERILDFIGCRHSFFNQFEPGKHIIHD